eukprot:EG_transcript_12909
MAFAWLLPGKAPKTKVQDGLADLTGYSTDTDFKRLQDGLKDLKGSKAVLSLCLADNCLTDKAAKCVADCLKHSRVLQKLDLSRCQPSPASFLSLVEAVNHCPSLQTLVLAQNGLTAQSCAVLAKTLAHLRTLDVSGNQIDGLGAACLISMANGCGLQHLDCSNNCVQGTKEVLLISNALKGDNTLLSLNLQGNPLTQNHIDALAGVQTHNPRFVLATGSALPTTPGSRGERSGGRQGSLPATVRSTSRVGPGTNTTNTSVLDSSHFQSPGTMTPTSGTKLKGVPSGEWRGPETDAALQRMMNFHLDRKKLAEFFGAYSHGFWVYPDALRRGEGEKLKTIHDLPCGQVFYTEHGLALLRPTPQSKVLFLEDVEVPIPESALVIERETHSGWSLSADEALETKLKGCGALARGLPFRPLAGGGGVIVIHTVRDIPP